MSNLQDVLSETEIDINRPSTSHSSTSQPLRSKSSVNNEIKVNKKSSSKNSPKNATASKRNQDKDNINNETNESVKDLTNECEQLNISMDNEQVQQRVASNYPKKNVKKKNRLKHLKIPQPHSASVSQQFDNYTVLNNSIPVQEYVRQYIAPVYGSPNSRYLENLSHHPQLRQLHSLPTDRQSTSVPNTPIVQMNRCQNPMNMPLAYSLPNTPKYLQNAMQHPLLKKSFSTGHNYYAQVYARPTRRIARVGEVSGNQHNSPRRQQTNNANNDDKKFEPFMSIEDVEKGLKNNDLIVGVLRINPKQFQHSYLSSTDRSEQDILIDGLKFRNRALEGDIVVVQLIEENDNEEGKENKEKPEEKTKEKPEEKSKEKPEEKTKHKPQENAAEISKETSPKIPEGNPEENPDKNPDEKPEEKIEEKKVNKQKRGKVVYIKEKVHNRKCIGSLRLMPDKNKQRALFVPRDHRVPRLNIPFTCWPDNFFQDSKSYEHTLFLAQIEEWLDTRFAVGKIVCNIGQSGDMMSETKAILAQTSLDITPFGPEVRHLYPRSDYTLPEEEISTREDCRKLCIFSIDPSNCRDIDDAISCRELENGNYEIGVHISDVAHFLTENTLLDRKVAEKATTIYLVERAYHMLPDDLCMLCSLFPGVDKLAFSVFWEINDNADILSHRFSKTIINSCCQLTYDHAQAILENRADAQFIFLEAYNDFGYNDVYKSIKTLGKISAILRTRRFGNGALRIDQPKVTFKLNADNGLPDSFCIYESEESHQLIEEFMLLANMAVAKRIYDDFPDLAFLRSHPEPSGYMLKQLAYALKPMGIDLNIKSAGDLHISLMHYVNSDNKGKAMVLNMLCAKPMSRAKYFCAHGCQDDEFRHYALNVPLYTHFTSPIRRYADIVVHRLLAASLKFRDTPNWKVDDVRMIATQCNKQKYNAKKAGELSTELYTLKYIELNSPVETEAVVVEVREKFIDTIVIAMGLNRRIFFNNDFPGEFKCIKNDAGAKLSKMEITWKDLNDKPGIKQTIEVFSTLKVELVKGDDMVKVETRLVRPQ